MILDLEKARELYYYEPNTGLVRRKIPAGVHKIGSIVGSNHSKGYIRTDYKKKAYFVHRMAWLLHYGEWPKNEIDHINGIKNDNRICNLRDVPSYVNQINKRKVNSCGCPGVFFNKLIQKWIAYINKTKNKQFVLGRFNNLEDAIKARKEAEILYYKK
jgi:hypothetical protein